MIVFKDSPQVSQWKYEQHCILWEGWHDPPTDVRYMNMLARQVAGILGLDPGMTDEQVGLVLRKPQEKIACIMREIKHSRHPAVRAVRKFGLPVAASVAVPEWSSIRCNRCHVKLSELPCISCQVRKAGSWRSEAKIRPRGMPDCGCGTTYPPGSTAKIELMRHRLEAGYSVFSKYDL